MSHSGNRFFTHKNKLGLWQTASERHRLMRPNKTDPTYKRCRAVFSQNISSFLAWSSVIFVKIFSSDLMSFRVRQKRGHASRLKAPYYPDSWVNFFLHVRNVMSKGFCVALRTVALRRSDILMFCSKSYSIVGSKWLLFFWPNLTDCYSWHLGAITIVIKSDKGN